LHVELARDMGGGAPQASIIGAAEKTSVPLATYANSHLAFALDYEDVVQYCIHAGPIVIPAALALCEQHRLSGREFLNAVVVGYEVGTRIGWAMQPSPERGSRVWGQQYTPFAACAAAGRLLGLDAGAMDVAFGVTGSHATVPSAYKYFGLVGETRPMREVKLGWGWMAMVGVYGALAAARGFGGGCGILDGAEGFWIMAGSDRCEFPKLVEDLGTRYLILDTDFKVHPSIAWNHPPHLALKQLLAEVQPEPDAIEAIIVEGLGVSRIDDPAPRTAVDAQFSLPYTIATTVLGEPLTAALYADAKLADPRIHALMRRVRCLADPQAERAWFESQRLGAAVTLVLRDGRRYSRRVEFPRDKPVGNWGTIARKFCDLAGGVLETARIERTLALVDDLEAVEDAGDLARLMSGSG
jgi:2-methylcitrate dehydratase PrpD